MKKSLLMIASVLVSTISFGQTSVAMNASSFSPAAITINQGETVTWTNNSGVPHTSTSGSGCTANGTWDSGTINNGQTFQRTFATAGTFSYFCTFHCAQGMTGTITVMAVTPTPVTKPLTSFKVNLYPNPVSENSAVEFELSEAGKAELIIFDVLNNPVYTVLSNENLSTGNHKFDLNSSSLSKGIYMMRLSLNGEPMVTERFVKQ